ncbi:MAG: hypothetical protein U0935_16130 [Pirellulales bacterium]
MTRAPSLTTPRSGCLGMLGTALLTCLLLVPNGWLALTVIQSLRTVMPNLLESPKLVQVVVFVLPMLLLVIEWWLFDKVRDRWRARRGQDAATATRQP